MQDWPHNPVHRLSDAGMYFVTAATYRKRPFFHSPDRLTFLSGKLFLFAEKYGIQLQAWSLFSNHYHLIAQISAGASLRVFIRHFHSVSARWVNTRDRCAGRHVWFQYWNTKLTYQRSYLARLRYVHQNPVRHGLVRSAADYLWCSARWFQENASPTFFNQVANAPCRLIVPDDFP